MNDFPQGLHHITAIAGDPVRNLQFYRDCLGLRLVKRTVNFDDPFTYHFYFGDTVGSPGTILTFFPWPRARRGSAGAGMIEAVAFAVPSGSLDFWRRRLETAAVTVRDRPRIFDERGLAFTDPDGMQLELVEAAAPAPGEAVQPWSGIVPAEHAIRAFHGATEQVRRFEPTDTLLRERLGFSLVAEESGRRRYRAGNTGIGVYDVVADPAAPEAIGGAGTVHHIAWKTADADSNLRWRERLTAAGVHVSPLMDRNYFHSIYFREPGGVLFEFATNGPGFAIDETAEALGSALKLPAQYEEHRARIEAALPPLPAPPR